MKVKLTSNEDFTVERGNVSVNVLDLSTKQDALVSGTNIKTINNESILGSGNITITGGGGTFTEEDPIFTASAAAGITSTDISNWNGKTSNTGTVTGVKMNGTTNNPTSGVVDLGTVVVSETTLSKGTTTGSGNAVTDITVSNHQITLTKGATFLTSEDISNKVDKVTSTDNAIVRFDGTTGDVQNSSVIVDDEGSVTIPTNLKVSNNIKVDKMYGDKRHLYNVCNIVHGASQKKHFAIYTNIVFPAAHMVVITMKGFNYSTYDFESKLTFYMYQGEFYTPRVQNLGAYDPTVYLFSYDDNGTNRVAIGLESTNFYFFGCQLDVHFPCVLSDTSIPLPQTQWTFSSDNVTYTEETPEEDRIIPSVGVNHCVKLTKNKLAVTTTGNVPLVTSTDNAIARFDGTSGNIQNSGVTIDDSNNISTSGKITTTDNVSVKNVIVHGSNNTNDTRAISSDSATNIYVDINGTTPLVVDGTGTPAVRPSVANSGKVNLGNTTSHWNEVRANKFVVDGGTSSQFLKADGSVDNNTYLTSYTETDPVFSNSVAASITSTDITNWNAAEANVQSDWNATSGDAQILNKPTNISTFTNDAGYLTSETSLTKGTTTGSGNAVTDISVNGHQITLTKGTTFLTEHQSLTSLANGIYYDSTNKRIYLRNGSNNLSGTYAYIDATDFIKDGMVDSVTVGNGTGSNAGVTCLIITFNTFDGSPSHQTIELPISQIFNASNYYTKSDIDNAGYLTSFTEVDPVFTASVASGITSSDISNWNGKTSNVGTVTGVKMNNGAAISPNSSGVVDLGTVITSHQNIKTVNNNSLTGTGNVSVGTVTGVKMNGTTNNPTSGVVDLGTVITSETTLTKGTTTGSGNAVTDISVNGHQITLTKGTTFLTEHQSLKTINNTAITGTGDITINELPTVSASDNGKVLQVVNGAWALVSPVTLYSGSSAPNNSQGNNGDIYLQT